MTIIEAISQIDDRKHNTYSQADKIGWLSKLDWMAKRLVIDTHEGSEDVYFDGYDEDSELETVLLIPEPYDEVYLRWLEAHIDYANGEYEKYNNSAEAYNVLWQDYQKYYNRTHMPKGKKMRFF